MRALVVVALAGCVDVATEHRCRSDDDCTRAGIGGTCEPSARCSFADVDCGGGARRYDETAGALAGVCVVDLVSPTPLGHIDLEKRDDTTRGSCAPQGARDAFVELISDRPQLVMIDTIPDADPPFGRTNANAHLTLRRGSCDERDPVELACMPPPCGGTYSRLIASVDAGRYCLVVEQSEPTASGGDIQLRSLPARRFGRVLDAPENVEMTVTESTCNHGPVENQCGPPSDAIGFLAPTCPGQYVSASFEAAPLDMLLSLRPHVPQQPFPDGCADPTDGQPFATPVAGPSEPWWIMVSSKATCGPVSLRYTIKR